MNQQGEALRLIRVFHDKKLSELAHEIGVSAGYISEVEKGKKQPSLNLIHHYAEAFDTSPSAILFFTERIPKNKKPLQKYFRKKIIELLQVLENAETN